MTYVYGRSGTFSEEHDSVHRGLLLTSSGSGDTAPTSEEIVAEVLRQMDERETEEEVEDTEETDGETMTQEAYQEEVLSTMYVIAETQSQTVYCLIIIICLLIAGFLHKLLYNWFEKYTS